MSVFNKTFWKKSNAFFFTSSIIFLSIARVPDNPSDHIYPMGGSGSPQTTTDVRVTTDHPSGARTLRQRTDRSQKKRRTPTRGTSAAAPLAHESGLGYPPPQPSITISRLRRNRRNSPHDDERYPNTLSTTPTTPGRSTDKGRIYDITEVS